MNSLFCVTKYGMIIKVLSFIYYILGFDFCTQLIFMLQFKYFMDFLVSVIGEQNYKKFFDRKRFLFVIFIGIIIGCVGRIVDVLYVLYHNDRVMRVLLYVLDVYGIDSAEC